jgi:hypothetical protein
VAGTVVLADAGGFRSRPPWSTWKPWSGGVVASIQRIARHVANGYRVSETGAAHLSTVTAALPPELVSGSRRAQVPILFRRSGTNASIRMLPAGGTAMYSLCGTCSTSPTSTSSSTRSSWHKP